MSEFKIGDIVKLVCHPQKMVVQEVGPIRREQDEMSVHTGSCVCVWIDDYGQPHNETYVKDILEEYPDEDPYKKKVLDAVRKPEKDKEGEGL